MKILDLINDPEVIVGLAPEELAYHLLRVANGNLQNGLVHRDVIISLEPQPGEERRLNGAIQQRVQLALQESLHWLETSGLIIPALDTNGANGFRVISRRGQVLLDKGEFDRFRSAATFSKSMLHPSIADRVWIALARSELADAVFIAFRTVEEVVRTAGGFLETDVGTELMRRAFAVENGPLTDLTQNRAEREALAHLFAGAIGSYKNPHSHRTVTINDPAEAQEMVLLASHLLRIVDSRRPRSAA